MFSIKKQIEPKVLRDYSLNSIQNYANRIVLQTKK
jgi:hypothetical protein